MKSNVLTICVSIICLTLKIFHRLYCSEDTKAMLTSYVVQGNGLLANISYAVYTMPITGITML